MKKVIVLFFVLVLNLFVFSDESRGLKSIIRDLDQNATVGKQYAVFIAINSYKYWTPLKNPVKDAKEIKGILEEKYLIDEFIELYDDKASKKGIMDLFYSLNDKVKENDSLFLFYAGHGHLDTKLTKKGSWIPVDGGEDELYQENWISNDVIRSVLDNLKSKHVLLISDSCFSGDILDTKRGAVDPNTNDYFKRAYQKVSRQILTSGASETVSDNSNFARALKTFLRYNNKPLVDPLMIFNDVRVEAAKNSTPMFGFIPNSNHQEGGSYLFFKKEEKSVEVTTTTTTIKQLNSEEKYLSELSKITIETRDLSTLERSLSSILRIKELSKIDNLTKVVDSCDKNIQKIKVYAKEAITENNKTSMLNYVNNGEFDTALYSLKRDEGYRVLFGLDNLNISRAC